MTNEDRHAIVIGGSMAGLITARVLTDHFDRVTVIERDHLPDDPAQRAGVPQARHAHILLLRGLRILEQLFPGLQRDLAAAGAESVVWTAELGNYFYGRWAPNFPSDFHVFSSSRNLLETVVRRRLSQDTRIHILDGREVIGLRTDPQGRVTGIQARLRGVADGAARADELSAALVVDASGRASRAPDWLVALGYERPEETTITAHLGYASRVIRRPKDPAAGLPHGWKGVAIGPMAPHNARGAVMLPIEDDQWIVTLAGTNGDYPPTDEAAFLEFARGLPHPLVSQVLQQAEPVTAIAGYRRTENRQRHYERLRRWPDNFVVLGDATCAFNPVYGQGMTTGALGAMTLDRCLRERRGKAIAGDRPGFAQEFQRELAKTNATPWLMATGEDLRWPNSEGGQPGRVDRLMQRYFDQVLRLAMSDQRVYRAFLEVMHLVSPPSLLFQPYVALSVARQALRGKQQSAEPVAQRGISV